MRRDDEAAPRGICGGVRGPGCGVEGLRRDGARDPPGQQKAIVPRADELAPVLVPAFLDYARTRGLLVDAARVRSPKEKPRVENHVAYVRESWFDGESFISLDEARASAERWCRDVAGARVHGTTREVPREVFEARERSAMKPAPKAPFDMPHWTDAMCRSLESQRLVNALLRLCSKFGNGRVEAICQSALAFDVVDVQRVARMLETAKAPASPPSDERWLRSPRRGSRAAPSTSRRARWRLPPRRRRRDELERSRPCARHGAQAPAPRPHRSDVA
ncbi:hypothetical protein [Sorangium cellulosum]|uniref:hypothetical protein n=1 Tax=Sorangium cellulosum TaxID=56 RepID=UPI000AD627D2|nr:hypothetical protein [Sorangium cellulosum]